MQDGQHNHCVGSMIVYVTNMKTIWNCIVYSLNAIPCPIKNWFIPQHQKGSRYAQNYKNNKGQHAKESQWANELGREREL